MIFLRKLNTVLHKNKIEKFILFSVFCAFLLYGFTLANKRYNNFEYGKFDLGNMAQIVWNTSNGNFMEVTDQFGTNMPRWGMSHVDPILAIFAPLIKLIPHPMVLVFFQHLLIASAIFPLYLLIKLKLNKSPFRTLIGFLAVGTYVLYPANGFALVWTGFHGISFVAPLLIWVVWLLEKNKFFIQKSNQIRIYWLLVILMLMGKEEIGAILAIGGIFVYFRNKKLGIQTIAISLVWFIVAFFVIIPQNSSLRRESVGTFVEQMQLREINDRAVSGDNFFMQRYSYLGDSYFEMVSTFVTDPITVAKVAFDQTKLNAINHLVGPLGYLVLLSPAWIISIPDIAITMLSKEPIFDVSNHRIAFVISSFFLSYVYLLSYLEKKTNRNVPLAYSMFVLLCAIYFSSLTSNPMYLSGKSFIQNKIIKNVLAQDENTQMALAVGDMKDAKVPRNTLTCLNEMVEWVNEYNPDIYTGPDYLGAHTSLREVNALFPARYWDAEFIVADLFETKTIGPLESSSWTFNKDGLRAMLAAGNMKHLYSCGKVSAFVQGTNSDNAVLAGEITETRDVYTLVTEKIEITLSVVEMPSEIDRARTSGQEFILLLTKTKGDFLDKTTFWSFVNAEDPEVFVSFIDYITIGSETGVDNAPPGQQVIEKYSPKLHKSLPSGQYHVFYGVGDLLRATEVYIGEVMVK